MGKDQGIEITKISTIGTMSKKVKDVFNGEEGEALKIELQREAAQNELIKEELGIVSPFVKDQKK